MLTLLIKKTPNKQKCTHLYKVHVYPVKLQPLAFVEEGNLGLRWALSPERTHNRHLKQPTSGCKDEYDPNEFVIVCLSLLSEAEHMCMKSNPRWEQSGCVWVKYCSESIKTLQGLIP